MYLLWALLCWATAPLWASDATGSIRGYAEDKYSGERLHAATISLLQNKKEIFRIAATEAGEFVLENLEVGLYDLVCAQDGYITQQIVGLDVREDRVKLAYFSMREGDSRKFGTELIYTYASLQAKLETDVTTVSRTEESAADAPASVFVITANDINERGYQTLSEVLEDIPGVEVNERVDPESYNELTIRGIFGNNKLIILVNGMRLSSLSSERTSIDKQFNIRHAERIELLVGPASAVYGADAFTGVVNIITKTGAQVQGAEISTSYGMYHTTQNSVLAGAILGDVQMAISGSFYRSNEPNLARSYPTDFDWYNTQYSQNGTMLVSPFGTDTTQVLPIRPFAMPRWAYSIQAQLKYKGWEMGYAHNVQNNTSSAGVSPNYTLYAKGANYGYALHTAYLRHSAQSKKSGKWSLESALLWNLYHITRASSFTNNHSGYETIYKFGYSNGGRLDEKFTYNVSKLYQLMVGAQVQFSATLPNSADLPHPFGSIGQSAVEQDLYYIGTDTTDEDGVSMKMPQTFYWFTRMISGVFMQHRFNVGDKLFITAGGRADLYVDNCLYDKQLPSSIRYSLNPRVGIVYHPIDPLRIKAFYGAGFLMPSGEAMFDHYGGLAVYTDSTGHRSIQGDFWQIPNKDLIPEKVNSTELTVDFAKGDLHIGATGFFNYGTQMILRHTRTGGLDSIGNFPVAVAQINDNEANLFAYGVTALVEYRRFLNAAQDIELGIRANYAFVDGVENEVHLDGPNDILSQQKLGFAARHTAKASLFFRYKGFSIYVGGLYRTGSTNEGVYQPDGSVLHLYNPAYYVLNAHLRYRLPMKKIGVEFFAKINNLTNNRYYHIARSTPNGITASPQDPIRIVGGVFVSFSGK